MVVNGVIMLVFVVLYFNLENFFNGVRNINVYNFVELFIFVNLIIFGGIYL